MKRFSLLFFLTCGFISSVSQAQTAVSTIEGMVVDGSTQQPMPFVTVAVYRESNQIDSLLSGSQTTEQGRFTVARLPAGVLKVRLSFVGYQSTERTITLPGQAGNLGKLSLSPETRLLKEVTVQGGKAAIEITPEKRYSTWART